MCYGCGSSCGFTLQMRRSSLCLCIVFYVFRFLGSILLVIFVVLRGIHLKTVRSIRSPAPIRASSTPHAVSKYVSSNSAVLSFPWPSFVAFVTCRLVSLRRQRNGCGPFGSVSDVHVGGRRRNGMRTGRGHAIIPLRMTTLKG